MIDPTDLASSAAAVLARTAREAAFAAKVVHRALSVEGRGVYRLGAGGRDPSEPTPLDAAGRCDCSGFLCWCWCEPRRDSADGEDEIAGEWIWTDGLYRDARGPQRFGREIAAPHVQPGDALVYRGNLPGQRIGHCAVVIDRPAVVRCFADVTVIHCHAGRAPAITRSSGALWDRKNGIAIRRVWR